VQTSLPSMAVIALICLGATKPAAPIRAKVVSNPAAGGLSSKGGNSSNLNSGDRNF
jgi:hypothetical protein